MYITYIRIICYMSINTTLSIPDFASRQLLALRIPMKALKALLLLLSLVAGTFVSAEARCSDGDRDALLAFKSQLIDADGVLASWNSATDCCGDWTGVFCNAQGTRVSSLTVNANCRNCIGKEKLIARSGVYSFGAPLGNLKALTSLAFNNVQIRFRLPIPQAFFTLPNLVTLQLTDCEFSGAIPTELGKLARLRELTVTGNRFSSGMPDSIANLKSLRILSLRENQLRDFGSSRVTLLPNLDRFDFAYNKLTGPVPQWLTKLAFVKGGDYGEVNLNFNGFSGSFPGELCSIRNLRDISMRTNKLTGSIPAGIAKCVALNNLVLSENQLRGPIPRELGKLTHLRYLYLDHNQFSGSLPHELGDLLELVILELQNNKLTGAIPDNYGPFDTTDFQPVSLGNNMLSGRIPTGLQNLAVSAFRPKNAGLCGTPLPNACK